MVAVAACESQANGDRVTKSFGSRDRRRCAARNAMLAMVALGGCWMAPVAVAQEESTIVKVDELSGEEFGKLLPALPDSAVLESHGTRVTVGALRKRWTEQGVAAKERAVRFARDARAAFEEGRRAFIESEKGRLAHGQAEALAAFERLDGSRPPAEPAEVAALREEMWTLRERAQTAAPQELMELERRVDYLLRRYSKIAPPPNAP